MNEYNRLREIFLCAFALYLATSVVQLHARQGHWPSTGGVSVDKIVSGFEWYMLQVSQAERDQGYLFAPGN